VPIRKHDKKKLSRYTKTLTKTVVVSLGELNEVTFSSSSEEHEEYEEFEEVASSSSSEEVASPASFEVIPSLWSSSSNEYEQNADQSETWPSLNQRRHDNLNLQLIKRVCSLIFSDIRCNTECVNKSGKYKFEEIFSHI
jgi:hypothetical protein